MSKPPAPPRVDNVERYWTERPPELSARAIWWQSRIRDGWRPNARIRSMGYHSSAQFYGVYIWEGANVIQRLLDELEGTRVVS